MERCFHVKFVALLSLSLIEDCWLTVDSWWMCSLVLLVEGHHNLCFNDYILCELS